MGALLAIALTFAAPAIARAEAGAVDWRAPAECPDDAELEAAIDRLLGASGEQGQSVVQSLVEAEVLALGGLFELRLRGSGARVVRARSCQALADVVVLISAMAVDPGVIAEPISRSQPARAAADPLAPPGPHHDPRGSDRDHPPVETSAASRGSTEGSVATAFVLRAAAVVDAGALPTVAFGPALAAGLSIGPARLDLVGLYLPVQFAAAENHETGGGDFWLLSVGVHACFAAVTGILDFGPCASVEVGALHGAGKAITSPGDATAVWVSASAGGYLALPLTPWLALRADVAVVVPIHRPAFVIDGVEGVIHRPGSVGVRGALGAEVWFR